MALIKCKYCGHPVSDKAVKCPKCGGDLTQTEEPKQENEVRGTNTNKITDSPQQPDSDASQEWYDDEIEEPENGKGLKILLVILAVIAVGGIGYFFYWNHQQSELKAAIEAARQDSIAAAELEAARLDSIRQDSIARQDSILQEAVKKEQFIHRFITSKCPDYTSFKDNKIVISIEWGWQDWSNQTESYSDESYINTLRVAGWLSNINVDDLNKLQNYGVKGFVIKMHDTNYNSTKIINLSVEKMKYICWTFPLD